MKRDFFFFNTKVMMILENISVMNEQQEKENTNHLSATVWVLEVPSSLNKHVHQKMFVFILTF